MSYDRVQKKYQGVFPSVCEPYRFRRSHNVASLRRDLRNDPFNVKQSQFKSGATIDPDGKATLVWKLRKDRP